MGQWTVLTLYPMGNGTESKKSVRSGMDLMFLEPCTVLLIRTQGKVERLCTVLSI